MKRNIILSIVALLPLSMFAQSAIDAYQISQPDMKGTARFMSMGGAFGALGGDLTTMSQNPAGVGVYRKSDIGFTVDLQCNSANAEAQGMKSSINDTKFLLNNIGAVFTYNTGNNMLVNFNVGFTYNRGASFNRHYRGGIGSLSNSLSNYIAGIANSEGATEDDLTATNDFDPYNPTDGGLAASWLSILGYNSYLISPEGNPDAPQWYGQWGSGTSGSGYFDVQESGGIDEYNISLGGNFANVLYWGMNFGIIDMNYSASTIWGENLNNAYVVDRIGAAEWNLNNGYVVNGTGFNYKIGVILKPIQELRLGLAVHTPTWYNINDSFYGKVNYKYPGNPNIKPGWADTNQGYTGVSSYNFRAPWKFIASAAGVIGNNFIISADYEWTSYSSMKYSEPSDYFGGGWFDPYWDDWYGPYYKPQTLAPSSSINILPSNDPYYNTNGDIRNYYQNTSTLRLGAEYRVSPQFSLRAGYSYTTSPIKQDVRDNKETIYTAGTTPQYCFDNHTQYITCGFGYKYRKFYIDMAYVYKNRSSEYHAYTPDVTSSIPSPQAKITDNNSQIVMSMGFKF